MLSLILVLGTLLSMMSLNHGGILYDVPVSNHGARIRMIIYGKDLKDIEVMDPSTIGGMKSEEYLKLNPVGKIPLLVDDSYPIPESDVIARYVLDKYNDKQPTFIPSNIMLRTLSDLICRWHDVYITNIHKEYYSV